MSCECCSLRNEIFEGIVAQLHHLVIKLTGLNGPMIREAMPFPSILVDMSSFFSPSFFTGGIPCDYETMKKI